MVHAGAWDTVGLHYYGVRRDVCAYCGTAGGEQTAGSWGAERGGHRR